MKLFTDFHYWYIGLPLLLVLAAWLGAKTVQLEERQVVFHKPSCKRLENLWTAVLVLSAAWMLIESAFSFLVVSAWIADKINHPDDVAVGMLLLMPVIVVAAATAYAYLFLAICKKAAKSKYDRLSRLVVETARRKAEVASRCRESIDAENKIIELAKYL